MFRSEDCLATYDGQSVISIVCHNCKSFNFSYYVTSHQHLTSGTPQWEQVFEDYTPLSLRFRLPAASGTAYRVTILSISREHGSAFDHWNCMGHSQDLPHEDIEYIKQVSIPNRTIRLQEAVDGFLEVVTELQPNEIQSLHIQPCT